MPSCSFCNIVAGDLDARIVLDDESCLAFLDQRPVFPGHCLVIPKHHYETLAELPDELTGSLFRNVKHLSSSVQQALNADGTFVAINNGVSQSVPHVHVHVVPRRHKDGLRGFFWPRQHYATDEEAEQIADRIRAAVAHTLPPSS